MTQSKDCYWPAGQAANILGEEICWAGPHRSHSTQGSMSGVDRSHIFDQELFFIHLLSKLGLFPQGPQSWYFWISRYQTTTATEIHTQGASRTFPALISPPSSRALKRTTCSPWGSLSSTQKKRVIIYVSGSSRGSNEIIMLALIYWVLTTQQDLSEALKYVLIR